MNLSQPKSERGKEITIDYKDGKIVSYKVNGKDAPIPKKYFKKDKGLDCEWTE